VKHLGIVSKPKDGGGGNATLNLVKCLLLCLCPTPLSILLCELKERLHMVREALNESMIKVHESKEGLYLFLRIWGWPLHHLRHLDWVHANLTFGYDQAKVFNGGLFKIAFVVLEEEFVFTKSLENNSCDMTMLLD
jgi:hypothetical protein